MLCRCKPQVSCAALARASLSHAQAEAMPVLSIRCLKPAYHKTSSKGVMLLAVLSMLQCTGFPELSTTQAAMKRTCCQLSIKQTLLLSAVHYVLQLAAIASPSHTGLRSVGAGPVHDLPQLPQPHRGLLEVQAGELWGALYPHPPNINQARTQATPGTMPDEARYHEYNHSLHDKPQ